MNSNIKVAFCILIAGMSSVALSADKIPEQPSKCPDLKLMQQKKAFTGVIDSNISSSVFLRYNGVTQIGAYDTNVAWRLEIYDEHMYASNQQEAANKAQKILDTTTGQPTALYDSKSNSWQCVYRPSSTMFTTVAAISPVPHNLIPQ